MCVSPDLQTNRSLAWPSSSLSFFNSRLGAPRSISLSMVRRRHCHQQSGRSWQRCDSSFLPLQSSRQIVDDLLDERRAKIDALIAKANEVIETLREYRSALITDAVTGKIDVRGAA